MTFGIAIVGGNGSGKTTLGRQLAQMLRCKRLDVEDYYFRPTDTPYTNPRSREEVRQLMLKDIKKSGSFVLSSVYGDQGTDINAQYTHIVYIQVPPDTRLVRVKQRSLDKFGNRVLQGGDMYEREQDFFDLVASRSLDKLDAWVQHMGLPVIYVDGTKPVADIAAQIKEQLGLPCVM